MKSWQVIIAIAVCTALAVGCTKKKGKGGDDDDDVVSEFGLDERPANPTCTAPSEPPPNTAPVTLAPFFATEQFDVPVQVIQHPTDDDRWYVVEKDGSIFTLLRSDPTNTRTQFADFSAIGQGGLGTEFGLLAITFHPDFASNGYVYVSYATGGGGSSFIERYTSGDNGLTLNMGSGTQIFSVGQPYGNHNGGMIAFGPDGYLYLSLGDGGLANDPDENAQDVTTVLGSILRLDVDGGTPYAIPSDNPFASSPNGPSDPRPEIYAWGLRNPWRFSFDPVTGDLWVGDVGQDQYEEIDKIQLGGNYGWDAREADECFDPTYPCDGVGYIDPVAIHPQNSGPLDQRGESITGGYVYRGSAIPELYGTYIYGDYVTRRVWALTYDAQGQAAPTMLFTNPGGISSFAQGRDGEVIIIDYNASGTAEINLLVPNGAPAPNNFPMTLSATGCMDANDVTKFYSGVIPYGVVQPFWSDDATKERGMALPDGTTIDLTGDGDFEFPIGTVLLKNFYKSGEIFETRTFVRHDDGTWAGYTYEWNAGKTDADLVQGGKLASVAGAQWLYPTGAQCLECHTAAEGRSLGPQIQQINRTFTYESTGRQANQLRTLDHIGMFSASLPDTPENLPSLVPAFGNDAVEERARTYVEVNCSMCHQPDGTALGNVDFRVETAFADMGICNVDPQEGDLGVTGAKIFVPGDPASSVMSLRMQTDGAKRMPKIGTIHDTEGISLINDWINSVQACP